MNPCAAPRGGMLFGRLVDLSSLTGYEPKTCIEVSSEHTPINIRRPHNHCRRIRNHGYERSGTSGRLPLFSQERDVSSNPFGVSGSQQQAGASGSQTIPWQSNRFVEKLRETGATSLSVGRPLSR